MRGSAEAVRALLSGDGWDLVTYSPTGAWEPWMAAEGTPEKTATK